MSTTPLYTLEELNTKIAKVKAALDKAYDAESYGKGNFQLTRQKIDSLENQLNSLHRRRMELEGVTGPQSIIGRVPRG